ncbi:MAG: hypothetical protein NZ772_14950, partial [Cyanobacteria bacterium]|nr:hypothetical protein [Cyanobacteriota bacterium]MDW8202666.1 hypothetical protein [Cyanobacteriota bacterium SKYGB_h_bin112]
PQIAQLTELGLVELTRKRQGQNIYELFSRPCEACGGLGHLVHLPGEPDTHLEPLERVALRDPSAVESRLADPRNRVESSRDRRSRSRGPVPTSTEPEFLAVSAGYSTGLGVANDLASGDEALGEDRDAADADQGYGNYSDRGSRRRRRRRDSKDSGRSSRNGQAEAAVYRRRDGTAADDDASLDGEADLAGLPSDELPAKETWPERSERRSRREPKSPAHPPEHISVVMTPEEQDVYALMGISPLVMLDQPVKDPRSAIITVLLPGEEPDEAVAPSPSVEDSDEPIPEADAIEPDDLDTDTIDDIDLDLDSSDEDDDEEFGDDVDASTNQLGLDADDLSDELDVDLTGENPSADDSRAEELPAELVNRRRRRRSSASST